MTKCWHRPKGDSLSTPQTSLQISVSLEEFESLYVLSAAALALGERCVAAREDLHSVTLHISQDKIQWWWRRREGPGGGVEEVGGGQASTGPCWWESLNVIPHAHLKEATVTL